MKHQYNYEYYEEHLLRYLKQHVSSVSHVQVILPEIVSRLHIPNEEWKEILSDQRRSSRNKKTIALWNAYGAQLYHWLDVMKRRLISVDTVLFDEKLKIIYSFQREDGILYFAGSLPRTTKHPLIQQLPISFQNIYDHIHDGFMVVGFSHFGFIESGQITCLKNHINSPTYVTEDFLKHTYMVFSNGMGDGIVFDLHQQPSKGIIFFSDDACDYIENPVDVLSEWMKLIIEE